MGLGLGPVKYINDFIVGDLGDFCVFFGVVFWWFDKENQNKVFLFCNI